MAFNYGVCQPFVAKAFNELDFSLASLTLRNNIRSLLMRVKSTISSFNWHHKTVFCESVCSLAYCQLSIASTKEGHASFFASLLIQEDLVLVIHLSLLIISIIPKI